MCFDQAMRSPDEPDTPALPADLAKKRDAASELLAAEPMPVPDTVEELKAELDRRGA
jgi:hypothetical protein